jgi:hypothetical protein
MRTWAKRRFDELWDGDSHPSHAAHQALEDTVEHFKLGCDVQGECTDPVMGRTGVSYINTGDSYDCTVYVYCRPQGARFHFGCRFEY